MELIAPSHLAPTNLGDYTKYLCNFFQFFDNKTPNP